MNESDRSAVNTPLSSLRKTSGHSLSFILGEISHICRNMKPRSPGSVGEREAAEYMAQVLHHDCGCDNTVIETFKEHPNSFFGYCRLSGFFDSMSCLGFFLHPLISLISGCISLILFLLFFVLYIPIIDWLFTEKQGTNVTALRPCSGNVERRVFFNGHIDAAWEFTLNHYFGGVVFEIPNLMALLGVLFYISISICALYGAGAWVQKAALWGLVFLPFFVAIAFTFNPNRVVDGANDNLSGCYMGIALLREMERQNISLDNTEVGVILTGSEEAGLRGAKAWSKKHRDDYRDVPTFIISFDTIHDPRFLMVNERDLNGTVKADTELAGLFLQAAGDVGIPCQKGMVPLFGGATDSAAFIQNGFRSVCITGLNHRLEDYYHTRRDSYDNLNARGLENCYMAAVRMLEMIDQGMLDPGENRISEKLCKP